MLITSRPPSTLLHGPEPAVVADIGSQWLKKCLERALLLRGSRADVGAWAAAFPPRYGHIGAVTSSYAPIRGAVGVRDMDRQRLSPVGSRATSIRRSLQKCFESLTDGRSGWCRNRRTE